VDWLAGADRPETYEEAALRELSEELALPDNWGMGASAVHARLQARMAAVVRVVNQVPSSHGYNNEWVTVFRLDWQGGWGDPCGPAWVLGEEGTSPGWRSVEEIERRSVRQPMRINSALRLFLRRRGVLVPLTR
jgi:8-oxo-dGTP pyrophosphatase MutT (NUDIX family)